jgi:hypothetical protein
MYSADVTVVMIKRLLQGIAHVVDVQLSAVDELALG